MGGRIFKMKLFTKATSTVLSTVLGLLSSDSENNPFQAIRDVETAKSYANKNGGVVITTNKYKTKKGITAIRAIDNVFGIGSLSIMGDILSVYDNTIDDFILHRYILAYKGVKMFSIEKDEQKYQAYFNKDNKIVIVIPIV